MDWPQTQGNLTIPQFFWNGKIVRQEFKTIIKSQEDMTDIYNLGKNIFKQSLYHIEKQEEGGFVAFSEEYSGAIGQGETEEEAIKDLEGAIQLLKEVIEEDEKAKASIVKP